jgi:cytochrome c biogenesis factor
LTSNPFGAISQRVTAGDGMNPTKREEFLLKSKE